MSRTNERGFALVTVLMVMAVVAALTVGATLVSSANLLGNRFYARQTQLDVAAEAGLEWARAQLNADRDLYPDTGYVVLENGVSVPDGSGGSIPGVRRWVYAGPTGNITGQYGVFGSIVAVTRDEGGGVVIRRSQVVQESFAKYAYFTDIEPSNISFGGGDQIFGPVHTNDYLKIYPSGATFHDETRTAKTVKGAAYGTFKKGYEEFAGRIEMPRTADLNRLRSLAATGGMAFVGNTSGGYGEGTTRIQFMAIDLNGDLDVTDEGEGFLRVYQSSNANWVSGDKPSRWRRAELCGHYHGTTFVAATDHPRKGSDNWRASLTSSTRRCYLGGSDEVSNGFTANDGTGQWLKFTDTPDPLIAGRPDARYLFPLSRKMNPSFKGVVFVDGKVVISGVLRGRLTVAATNQIIIGDDIVYANDPSQGTCTDLLGIFSGDDVVMADNTLNSPQQPSGSTYRTMDDSKDEFVQGIVLALDIFTTENYASGSLTAERCEGKKWGRGCLYLTGGIVQRTRGAVGTISSGTGGTGYVKRYAYDRCGASDPPPYFPTTGHFARGQMFPVEPVGFDVATYFDFLSSGG